jgi:murein DD-endopeptidase MepM/ murein hydrolase activator NlpD
MKCYSGGVPGCTLSNNPNFFPNLYKFYTQMIAPDTPGYPEGNCVLFQPAGPGLACLLWPGTFDITCDFTCYAGHKGMDFGKCGQDFTGQPIYAVDDGTLNPTSDDRCGIGVNLVTNYGIFVYCHLLNRSDIVTPGATVKKGELLGFTDSTGEVTGPHLHFGFWVNGAPQDPVTLGIPCISTANTCH